MYVLCLQVAIAAGDYLSSNLMCYSGGSPLLQWAATAKSIAVQPSSATIQRGLSQACEFRIHLTARTVIIRLYTGKP